MSWLKRRITVDGIRVEGADARRLMREVYRDVRSQRGRRTHSQLIGGLILVVGLSVLWAVTISFAPVLLPAGWRNVIMPVGSVLVGLVLGRFIVVSYFRANRDAFRRAMNRRGFELCTHCGYWLKGLDQSATRCPECGAERPPEQSHEDDEEPGAGA